MPLNDEPAEPLLSMSAASLSEEDREAVLEVLTTGVLALGPKAEGFERSCAEVAGTAHAVAVSSGTAGLHLIAVALGLGPGDEVLVPSFTFAASVNAILYVGARPVFCDIEPDTFNIDPSEIRAKRTERTKAVMVVDVFGHPADWDAISTAADGLLLIDDSCEAIGARYKGRSAGGFGNAGCFAFYPNKQITTGEGGMILTDDPDLAELCRSLRNQGRGKMDSWLEHERLGFNYRLDELSAALGVSQISRLQEILKTRAGVASMYTERLIDFAWLQTPVVREDVHKSWFVYVITLSGRVDRDGLIGRLGEKGVPSRAYFTPVHRQAYIQSAFGDVSLPVSEGVAARSLALPFHTELTEGAIDRVADALSSVA